MSLPPPDPTTRATNQLPVPVAPNPTSAPPPPPPNAGQQLAESGGWRLALGVTWVLAFFAYASVWQASVEIGIRTWWVGPRAQPTPTIVRFIPFLLCIVMTTLMITLHRRIAIVSAAGAVAAAAIAIPDFDRTTSLGVVEVAIAALILLVSASAYAGRYRPTR
ncbi:MAG: hypothetical protein AB8G26_04050 [Ilumatobacter sp.]